MKLTKFVTLFLASVLIGCATSQSGAKKQTYKEAAKGVYERAESELEGGGYKQAIKGFRMLRERFPYSRYAKLASVRIADAYFKDEKYRAAAEQYKRFVELNPNHKETIRAEFRIASSYYRLMPGNWFFQPPAHERDLSMAKQARRRLQRFLEMYEKSDYIEKARTYLTDVTERLAKHELSVAEFYIERSNYKAAKSRINYLLQNYAGTSIDAKALFLLAKTNLELGRSKGAKTALKDLLRVHPNTEYAEDARRYLDEYEL